MSEFRANFSARNFHEIHRGAGTETEKALFPFKFLRNGTSIYTSRKIELTGTLGIFLAGKCCCICVCFIKQFFLLVDIQHSQCPRWFFVPEIQALWSPNCDTGSYGTRQRPDGGGTTATPLLWARGIFFHPSVFSLLFDFFWLFASLLLLCLPMYFLFFCLFPHFFVCGGQNT